MAKKKTNISASKRQILLTEYQVCQQHNDSIGSQVWVATTIFLSINVTLLGGLIYTLITKMVLEHPDLTKICWIIPIIALIGVTILGIGIIWILRKWIDWLKRMRFRTAVNFERMHTIERLLGMCKHTISRRLDRTFKKAFENKKKWTPEQIKIFHRHTISRWLNRVFNKKKWTPEQKRIFKGKEGFWKYYREGGYDGLICIAKILMGVWSFSVLILWVVAIISLFDC